MSNFTTYDDYKILKFKKKDGSYRIIMDPKPELKEKQKKHLHERIYKNLIVSYFAHGFVRYRNIVSNALPHVGKKWILKMDIKNFFRSTSYKKQFLFNINCLEKLVTHLIKDVDIRISDIDKIKEECKIHFCLEKGSNNTFLPQGAPASPALANFCLYTFDNAIFRKYINKYYSDGHNIDYTRYADDITISCDNLKVLKFISDRIISLLENKYSYQIHPQKIKFIPNWRQQRVCGIVVNNKVNVPRSERRKMRAILHQISLGKIEMDEHILGKINFMNMVKKQSVDFEIFNTHRKNKIDNVYKLLS